MKLLLDIPTAAAALSLSRSTVYELIARREIDAVHVGRAVRIPADALQAYVDRLRVGEEGPNPAYTQAEDSCRSIESTQSAGQGSNDD